MNFSKLVKTGVFLSSLTAGGTYLAFNSIYIDYHKDAMQLYERGLRKRLNENVKQLYSEVVDEIKLPEEMKMKLKNFSVTGFDVFNIGSLHLGDCTYIGLPAHFQHCTAEEIESLKIFKQVVNLKTASGRKLREALVLSEEAKKFAIARDIYYCDSYRVHFKAALLSSSVLLPHILYYVLRRRLASKPTFQFKSVKMCAYMPCALIGYLFYCLSVDLLNQHYEKIADRRAILLGNGTYFDGALEYYRKMLQRNRALRRMMGENGSKYFTSEGNEVVYFRRIHLPITTRIAEIEEFKNPLSTRQ